MEPTTYVFKKAEGLDICADVYDPKPGALGKPVIVFIHGGALMMGYRKSPPANMHDELLAEGYVVVSIDYRLAPETKLAGIIEDLRDAFRWVGEEGPKLFGIDPDRMGVTGNSAGGYMALMAGWAVTPRPKAIVSFYGYGDLIGDWYSKPDPFYCTQPMVDEQEARAQVNHGPLCEDILQGFQRGKFYLYCRQHGIWPYEVAGFDPHTQPEEFTPYCPLQHVTPDFPPTILLHGDNDTDVPYEQSVLMAEAFRREGVEHEFITIPGGPHGFDSEMGDPVVANAVARAKDFIRERV